MIKGDLDIVGGTICVNMLNAMAKGAKMRLVADKAYISAMGCDHFALLARKDLIKDVKIFDPVYLKGKRVAVKPSRSTEYYLEKILEKAGLTINDITAVNIPDEIISEAIKNRNIDFAVTAEPWITRAIDTGQGMVWIPAKQIIPDWQIAIVLFGPNLIDKYTDSGKTFMVAYLKAVRQYNKGKTKRNLDILNKYKGLTNEFLIRSCWAPLRDDGQIHIQSILDFQSWALMKDYLDKPATKDQLWDPRFIKYANKVLGESKR
jgi:ABC-type nitrate/sulfonate/bicarbonate transport system substrate-binding protein